MPTPMTMAAHNVPRGELEAVPMAVRIQTVPIAEKIKTRTILLHAFRKSSGSVFLSFCPLHNNRSPGQKRKDAGNRSREVRK